MRAYFFTNMYLSSIQHGIQSAHCLHEMFRKYQEYNVNHVSDRAHEKMLYNWADHHKTIIVKNGGPSDQMKKINEICSKMNLPNACFYEPSLDNALTCVGVIVPARLYDRNIVNQFSESWTRSKEENEFIELLANTKLAS